MVTVSTFSEFEVFHNDLAGDNGACSDLHAGMVLPRGSVRVICDAQRIADYAGRPSFRGVADPRLPALAACLGERHDGAVRHAVSPERDSDPMVLAASGSATTATMPMPQLKVRCISCQAMAPWSWIQSKTGGRGQALVSMTARVSGGMTRGRFS
jgi:hypothetical protein